MFIICPARFPHLSQLLCIKCRQRNAALKCPTSAWCSPPLAGHAAGKWCFISLHFAPSLNCMRTWGRRDVGMHVISGQHCAALGMLGRALQLPVLLPVWESSLQYSPACPVRGKRGCFPAFSSPFFFNPSSVSVNPRFMSGKALQCSGGGRYLGTEFEEKGVKMKLLQEQDYVKTLFC